MTETKTSPRPWKVDSYNHIVDSGRLGVIAAYETRDGVASEKWIANARLIVSAVNAQPGLVKTLKKLREYLDNQCDHDDPDCRPTETEWVKRIDQALALASTNETPS